jgi:DNA-binding LacI/PurR family transcriptional regulator
MSVSLLSTAVLLSDELRQRTWVHVDGVSSGQKTLHRIAACSKVACKFPGRGRSFRTSRKVTAMNVSGNTAAPPDDAGLNTSASSRAFVGAREVAALAGVSRSAVSRTFTPGASVSEETRRRVLAAATELGYHVNHLARGLMRRETGIVCLIVADIESPQQARMVRAITARIQAVGKVAMVLSIDGPGEDATAALRQTLNYRADATVVVSGTPAQSLVRTCLDNGQQLILINRDDRIDGPNNIRLDNAGAAHAAFYGFLRAECRRLAVVNSELGTPSLLARETSFVAAAALVGLDVKVVRQGMITSYENGLAAGRRLFTAIDWPDAVFCVNDVTACGVMDAARREFGLRVPEDVSIIGFDNIKQAGWLSYALTTFDHPMNDIAMHVVSLISGEKGDGSGTSQLELKPAMIWRHSVRGAAT